MTAQALLAGAVGIAACIDDLRRRQISNWIPGSALASGLVLQTVQHGWRGAGSSLLGTVAGASVFLIFYLLGGMGGGDVKLMAGFGAILGVHRLLEAALWTAACGGVFAAVAIGFSALRSIIRSWSNRDGNGGLTAVAARPLRSIPYAPAIAAGVWLSLVPKT